jgi:hypothetical protein
MHQATVQARSQNVNTVLATREPREFLYRCSAPKAQHLSRAWGNAPGIMASTKSTSAESASELSV